MMQYKAVSELFQKSHLQIYFREQKELFRYNKKHFLQFLKDYHLVKKNKNLLNNSGHKL